MSCKRELTIIIVTHNLQQAARVSDTTAFFYLGRLIEIGPTDRMFTSPRERAHRGVHHREVRMTPPRATAVGFRHFHDQLAQLKQRLLDMSDLATSLLDLSVDALLSRDANMADAVITGDRDARRARARGRGPGDRRCSRSSSRWRATFASSSRRSRCRTTSSASATTR